MLSFWDIAMSFTIFPISWPFYITNFSFQERVERDKRYFLETEQGAPYASVFKSLRFNHLVNHHMDMDMLLKDRIIPKHWMSKVYQRQWLSLLRVDQGIDRGPQSLSDDQFDKMCLR